MAPPPEPKSPARDRSLLWASLFDVLVRALRLPRRQAVPSIVSSALNDDSPSSRQFALCQNAAWSCLIAVSKIRVWVLTEFSVS